VPFECTRQKMAGASQIRQGPMRRIATAAATVAPGRDVRRAHGDGLLLQDRFCVVCQSRPLLWARRQEHL
jgi:hypothetical protein